MDDGFGPGCGTGIMIGLILTLIVGCASCNDGKQRVREEAVKHKSATWEVNKMGETRIRWADGSPDTTIQPSTFHEDPEPEKK